MIPIFQGKARFVRITSACAFACISLLLLSFTLRTALFAASLSQEPNATDQTGTITGHVTGADGGDLEPLEVSIFGIEPT
jgi:hypothetical protein